LDYSHGESCGTTLFNKEIIYQPPDKCNFLRLAPANLNIVGEVIYYSPMRRLTYLNYPELAAL
jgi:hypothetical protein